MTSIADIRLKNMKKLADEAGSVSELGKRAGYKQPSYLYQIINQTAIQNGKPKNVGSRMARKLETAMGKEEGWMDREHDELPNKEGNVVPAPPLRFWSSNDPLPENDYVFAPFLKEFSMQGGAGGFENHDYNGFRLPFGKATLYRMGIQIENVFSCTIEGDSMWPRIEDGATIAVDKGRTAIKDGDIYAFMHDGLYRVKYLYKLPGGKVKIKSQNEDGNPEEVVSGDEIEIIGRVFWWSVLV